MYLYQKEIDMPLFTGKGSIIKFFERHVKTRMLEGEIPIRFALTKTTDKSFQAELGILKDVDDTRFHYPDFSIFEYSPRSHENTKKFNAVLLIPTGIGAELGGHSGDAGALARLIASACDTLITHPNVVNASDINELPENGLYVEGSVISSLMLGSAGLQEVRANRILLIMEKRDDKCISDLTINTASAARVAIGIDIGQVLEVEASFKMESKYSSSGCAAGRVEALENLCDLLAQHIDDYDAVALHTGIDVPEEFHFEYLRSRGEMVNPWGGVEAMLTHSLTMMFGLPTAHAPMVKSIDIANLHAGVVDPRISSEAISSTFLLSVLKGLHKSPRIISDPSTISHPGIISNADISCLIIPDGCVGLPTLAAMEQGIPVIAVKENKNRMVNSLEGFPFQPGKLFMVENYLEAIGVMNALKAGVSVESVRRPFADTKLARGGETTAALEEDQAELSTKVVKLKRD